MLVDNKPTKRGHFKQTLEQIKISRVGKIFHPFQRYEKIIDTTSLHLPSYSTDSMVYMEKRNQIVLIDAMGKSFKITDTNGNFIETIFLREYLERPKGMCYNPVTDEIFVADNKASKTLVFKGFNFELNRIMDTIKNPVGICIDIETSRLFVGSSRDYQDVIVYNCNTSEIIQRINCRYSVNYIKQSPDYLVMSIYHGFLLVNKSTCEIIKTINIDFNCEFFEILDSQFILTVKAMKEQNFLVLIDFNGNIVSSTRLTVDFEINDLVTIGDRMILNSGRYNPNVHVIKFD